MKIFKTDQIKNVVLLGHSGSGKTTLSEAMLFEAGVINRIGKVTEKNTTSDYTSIEQDRGNSIFSCLMNCQWKDTKINILDTPGFDDFVGEVVGALKVSDLGLMLINGANGVEVGTELIWEYATQFKKPIIFAINHLDNEKSDYDTTLDQIKNRFGNNTTVIQYPYVQGLGFNAIIDVLKLVMYKFPDGGGKPEKVEIPEEEKEKAAKLHNALIESIAENDETLMEKYFEEGTLTEEEMTKGLNLSIAKRDIYPLFCLSADRNMGSGRIMGFINDIAPGPTAQPFKVKDEMKNHPVNPDADSSMFVYKTVNESHLGDMNYFKVTSGSIKNGDDLYNMATQSSERINQLFSVNGKKRETVDVLYAGDIGVTVKLKNTKTNNTLSVKGSNIELEPIVFPTPRIRTAVVPMKGGEEEKLAMALNKIKEEDPSLTVEQSTELKQTLIHGQGELQLQIIKNKIENDYGVVIDYIKPKIPYRETIKKAVREGYRHKKQSGGSGQFGEVHMQVEPYFDGMPKPSDLSVKKEELIPLNWGGHLKLNWCIVGGSIDAKYINAILKGIMEKMENGPITGSYARDICVSIYDGKMHAVDSNDMAFKLAATQAFKTAFNKADPQLLEPIYEVEVLCPEEIMGDVMSDLQGRRAIILGMDAEKHYQKITAKVPLSELYKYSSTLRSLSQGRAKHNRKFSEYAKVPAEIQQELKKQIEETVEA